MANFLVYIWSCTITTWIKIFLNVKNWGGGGRDVVADGVKQLTSPIGGGEGGGYSNWAPCQQWSGLTLSPQSWKLYGGTYLVLSQFVRLCRESSEINHCLLLICFGKSRFKPCTVWNQLFMTIVSGACCFLPRRFRQTWAKPAHRSCCTGPPAYILWAGPGSAPYSPAVRYDNSAEWAKVARVRPKPPVSNQFAFWLQFISPSRSLRCTIARWKKFLPKSSNVAGEKNKVAGKICGRSLAEFYLK